MRLRHLGFNMYIFETNGQTFGPILRKVPLSEETSIWVNTMYPATKFNTALEAYNYSLKQLCP